MQSFFPKSNYLTSYKAILLFFSISFFSLSVNAQFTFTGSGDWSVPGNWDGMNVPTNGAAGITISIAGNATINFNNWQLGSGSTMTINNGVTLTMFSTNNRSASNTGTITNNGAIEIPGNNNIFDNNGTVNNNGTLNIQSRATFNNNATLNNGNTGTITNNNDLFNNSAGTINNEGNINTGSQNMDNFRNSGSLINNGTITRNDGNFFQNADGASISGSGTINMNGDELDISAGSISPGNSVGTMAITGSLSLSGITLNMEVNGDGTSDLITVTGSASISGTLNLIYGPGSFSDPETWTILQAGTVSGSLSGTFLPVNSTPPVAGATLTATYPSNTVLITYTGPSFVPIELASFTGQSKEDIIQLDWTTASETNNDYIMIERSGDGLQFQEIGRVKGYGTTVETQTYQFIDENPLNGLNYYRLRQVDFDGTEEYSNVIAVDIDMIINGIKLNLSPNPSQDLLRMVWQSSMTSEDGTIHLIEAATGKELQRFAIPQGTNQMEISVADLPQGVYVIQMIQDRQQKAVQFVKN